MALEYESVLMRLAGSPTLSAEDVDGLVSALCRVAAKHDIHYLWRPFLPDPGDDFILELAVESDCKFIVTFNPRDFAGAESFGIRVVSPGEFLRFLRGAP